MVRSVVPLGMTLEGKLSELLDLLDQPDGEAVGTSIRIPANLRQAAVLAAELGFADSTSEITVEGLRERLTWSANQLILEQHFQEFPQARPSLAEVALATAELDDSPLRYRPDLIERAATEVCAVKAGADADDVLIYAAALASASPAA